MRRNWKRFICAGLITALAVTGPIIDAENNGLLTAGNISQVFATSAKEKKKQAEQDLEDTKNKIDDLKVESSGLSDDIAAKSAELDKILAAQEELKTDIENKQKEIEQNQIDLADAQAQQEEQYSAMKKRIQFMYENSTQDSLWTAILEADGITDMLNRIEYVADIYSSDRALLESYQAAVAHVQEVGDQLNADLEEFTQLQAQYESQQDEIEAAIVELENERDTYAAQIAQAEQQAEEYQDIISTQAAIIQQQEAAAAAAAAAEAARNSSSSSNNSSNSSSSYQGGGAGTAGKIASEYAAGGGKNPSPTTSVSGSDVVAYAKQFVGNRYVWGGNSLTEGCDCSGFVHLVYQHFGIDTPRYSQSFKTVGQAVSYDCIQPGDVVVYPGHVAIYAGGGIIVEAQSTAAGITCKRSVLCHEIYAIRRLV